MKRPWWPGNLSFTIPTMLSEGEQRLLYWLASSYRAEGDIVDLGCFLGGSTAALAAGLRDNPFATGARVHSYDMFVCPRDKYSQDMIGSRKPGESVLDLFEQNVAPLLDLIRVHAGDVKSFPYDGRPIQILFVDVAKTADINDFLLDEYFPHLAGENSIIIHQDYNHPYLPWVHWTANLLRPYSQYFTDEQGSRACRVTKSIPLEVLKRAHSTALSFEEKCALLKEEIRCNEDPYSAGLVALGLAWLVFLERGVEAAIPYLDRTAYPLLNHEYIIPQSAQMEASMRGLGSNEGFQKYHDTYFKKY